MEASINSLYSLPEKENPFSLTSTASSAATVTATACCAASATGTAQPTPPPPPPPRDYNGAASTTAAAIITKFTWQWHRGAASAESVVSTLSAAADHLKHTIQTLTPSALTHHRHRGNNKKFFLAVLFCS